VLQTHSTNFDFVFDIASHSTSAIRIRELLSKMFEKAWETGVGEQSTDENIVLRHVITWPSFHRFLGFFCEFDLLQLYSILELCIDVQVTMAF